MDQNLHDDESLVRRVVLAEILGCPDVALALGLRTPSAARRAILRGEVGPYIRRGRRLLVLRDSLLAHLRASQVTPDVPAPPPPPVEPPAWARDLLERTRRGGRP